jgi:hypothetical protein
MNTLPRTHLTSVLARGRASWRFAAVAGALALPAAALTAQDPPASPSTPPAAPGAPATAEPRSKASLDETRITMTKWIETQQIIAKERNDWQQGKEILKARVELVEKEVSGLEGKIKEAQASVAETNRKRDELQAESDRLKATADQLGTTVAAMEAQVRALAKTIPDPVRTKLEPLFQRIPADPAKTNASVAERFQNVLGILNEVSKANSEISVSFEVRSLADGTKGEVQTIYVGLGQAYYISPKGETGVGRPTADGWKWEKLPDSTNNQVLTALEILQGKHVPAFVPLPVKIQ